MGFENTCRECDKPIGWHNCLCQQCKAIEKMAVMAEKAREKHVREDIAFINQYVNRLSA